MHNWRNRGKMEKLKHNAHFILQGKGGIGKTFVAIILSSYLKEQKGQVLCIDADDVSRTLGMYEYLSPIKMDISNGLKVNEEAIEALFDMINNAESDIVIDVGASGFIPITQYMLVFNNHIEKYCNKRIVCHSVIVGNNRDFKSTAEMVSSILNNIPYDMIIWANDYFGKASFLEYGGCSNMPIYQEEWLTNKKFKGCIEIDTKTDRTELYKRALEHLMQNKKTLAETGSSLRDLKIIEFKNDIYAKLDEILK